MKQTRAEFLMDQAAIALEFALASGRKVESFDACVRRGVEGGSPFPHTNTLEKGRVPNPSLCIKGAMRLAIETPDAEMFHNIFTGSAFEGNELWDIEIGWEGWHTRDNDRVTLLVQAGELLAKLYTRRRPSGAIA